MEKCEHEPLDIAKVLETVEFRKYIPMVFENKTAGKKIEVFFCKKCKVLYYEETK